MDRYILDRWYILQILSTVLWTRGAWVRFWIGFRLSALARETDGRKSFHDILTAIGGWFLVVNFGDQGNGKTSEPRRFMGVEKVCGFRRVDTSRWDQVRFKIAHEINTHRELFVNICKFEDIFTGFRVPNGLQTVYSAVRHVRI